VNSHVEEGPVGLTWDRNTASCAYDALFTILHNFWLESTDENYLTYSRHNVHWKKLHREFENCNRSPSALIQARNRIRGQLHAVNRRTFPINGAYTCLPDLLDAFLHLDSPIACIRRRCPRCKDIKRMTHVSTLLATKSGMVQDAQIISNISTGNNVTVEEFYAVLTRENQTRLQCATCKSNLVDDYSAPVAPTMCAIDLVNSPIKVLSKELKTYDSMERSQTLRLGGIIYYDESSCHFVSKIIDKEGTIWYHDGIETAASCRNTGKISETDMATLLQIRERVKASVAFYVV